MNVKSLPSILFAALCAASVTHAETWVPTGGGTFNWNDTPNWSPSSAPNGVAGNANLNIDIAANTIVNLASDITLNILTIGDTSGTSTFTLNPTLAQTLTIGNPANAVASLLTKNGSGADVINVNFATNDNILAAINGGSLTFGGTFSVLANTRLDSGVDPVENFTKSGGGTMTVNGNIFVQAGAAFAASAGTVNMNGQISRYLGQVVTSGATANYGGAHNIFAEAAAADGILVTSGTMQFGSSTVATRTIIGTGLTQTGGTINFGLTGGAATVNMYAGLLAKGNGTLQLQNGTGGGTTNILGGNVVQALSVVGGYGSGTTTLSLTSVTGLYAGMRVYGVGIVNGALIQSVNTGANQITLTLPTDLGITTQTELFFAEGPQNRSATLQSTNVVLTSNTAGYAVGQTVSGAGIPTGARITAINPGVSITLDTAATASGAATINAYAPATLRLAGASSTTNILSGPGTATGTVNFDPSINLVLAQRAVLNFTDNAGTIQNFTVSSLNSETSSTTVTAVAATPTTAFVGAKTVAGSNHVFVSSNAGLLVGQTVTGAGIPDGARIFAIINFYIILDKVATATSDLVTLTYDDYTVLRSQAGAATLTVGNYSGVDDRFDGRLDFSSSAAGSKLIKVGSNTLTLGGYEDNPSGRVDVFGGTLILAKESHPSVHAIGATLTIGDGIGVDTVKIGGTHVFDFNPNYPAYMTPVNNYRDQIYRNADVTINAGGVLDLDGYSEGFDQLLGVGTVTNNGAVAATLLIGEENSSFTSSTSITSGASQLGLVKAGTGTVTFDTAKTYTGSTLVSRGQLTLSGNGALTGTSVLRVANGTLFLDNTTTNNSNRINDSAAIWTSNATFTVRNNNTAGVNTTENLGIFNVDTGHTVLRIDHNTNVANTVRIHLAGYNRVGGSQISIVENTANPGFGNDTNPSDDRAQVTIASLPSSALLIGGGAASGQNQSILLGAFGGPNGNNTNNFMVVQNVGGTLYIRPLIDGSTTEYTTLASGTVTNGIGLLTGSLNIGSNTAFNSLRIQTSTTILSINDAVALKLGGNSDTTFSGTLTQGAGMMILASSGVRIQGGTLDFGIREAILRVNGTALIQSQITGTNADFGLTKSGGATLDLLGNNTYTGQTTIIQGALRVFHNNALGATGAGNGTRIMTTGNNVGDTLLIGLGATIGDLFDPLKREDLVMEYDSRFAVLNQNNVWNGNIILEGGSEATAASSQNIWFRTREDTAILTINGDVTGGGNSIYPTLNGAAGRQLVFEGANLRENIININGAISDENFGSATLGDYQKLNLLVRGSTNPGIPANEFHVNIDDATKVHGQLDIQNGFVRLGSSWGTDPTIGNNFNLIMRMRSSSTDSANYISALFLTQAGSVFNTPNVVWADLDNGYSVTSYGILGAEITSGVVTIGNGTGNLDFGPAADAVAGQSFGNSGSTVVAGTNVITLGAFDVGKDIGNLRPGMLLTGSGIAASTYILRVDTANNQIIINTTVGTAGAGTIGIASIVFNDATSSTTTNQQYADARLYAMLGGELDIKLRLVDEGGFSLENEVGAVTKVGKGVVRLSGSTNLAGELDGGVNLHGGTLILDYTQSFLRKITSGTNQQAPITLAGGDLFLRGASGLDITTTDDLSQEDIRGIMVIRAGESLIRVQSGGVANNAVLNLGPPSTLFAGGGMLPVRYAGGTVAFWRDTSLGGSSTITLELPDIYTGSVILPWAVYANNVTGKIVDFAYGRAPSGVQDLIEVAGASTDGGLFALENGAAFFGDAIHTGRHGYYAETTEILGGEGSGFFGTISLGTNNLRALLFNIDNDNTNGTDYANNNFNRLTNNEPNNQLKIATGTTITLVSELPSDPGFLGGAILIANTVGNTNKTITGGAISSGLETYYFDADINDVLVKSYDLIVHNYAEAPNFTNQSLGGGIFTIESNIVNNPADPTAALNFVHSGTGWTKMYRASEGADDGRGLGQGYSYTGSTFFNGGTIWVSDPTKLGVTPSSFDEDNFYFTGGRLRIADMTNQAGAVVDVANASIVLDANRGIMLGGDGAYLDIASAGTTLTINGRISVEQHSPTFAGGVVRTSNLGVGDIVKEGLGTLIITAQNNTFSGLLEVQEGTVIARVSTSSTPVAGAASAESTLLQNQGVLGSSYTFIDGTYVNSGATLRFEMTGNTSPSFAYGSKTSVSEWITLDGGTLGTTVDHNDGALQGILRVRQNSTIDIVGSGILRINPDAGYIEGAGNLTKTGAGTLHLYENSPEFTGDWTINGGRVTGTSQGAPLGTGDNISLGDAASTTPTAVAELFLESRITSLVTIRGQTTGNTVIRIMEGDTANLFIGMPVTGPGVPANTVITEVRTNGAVFEVVVNQNIPTSSGATLDFTASLAVNLPLEYDIDHDIVVNAEASGAPEQIKRIGAYNHDSFLNSGQNNDRYQYNGTITLNDDLRLTYGDSTANTGISASGRDVMIALNNNISGAATNDIQTEVIYTGNVAGNTSNDLRVYFELNGNNSAWLGDLIMGNSGASDLDTTHIVRLGSSNALTVENDVHLNFNNSLQLGGNNISIGNLFTDVTGVAALTGANVANGYIIVENASNNAGTLTINQTVDEVLDVIFQNGTTPPIYSAVAPTVANNVLNIVKAGSATLTLRQNSIHSGTTTVVNGILRVGASGVLSDASQFFITATGAGTTATLDVDPALTESIPSLTMGGTTTTSTPKVTIGTGSTLTVTGNITYDAANNPAGGTITGGTLNIGTGAVNSFRNFIIGNSTTAPIDLSVSSVVANNSGIGVSKSGAGTLEFSNAANTYTGNTEILGGVLQVNTIVNGSLASGLGTSSNAAGSLVLNGGTLRYVGATTSTDRSFTLGVNGGTIDASGTGAINFASATAATITTGGARTLTLTGTNTDGNRLGTVLADSTGATSVAKTGAGTWILGANNNYTGTTTVTEGRLQVGQNGTTAARSTSDTGVGGAGQGATTVNAGAYIGGTGTIRGQASVTNHILQGTMEPGDYTGTSSGLGKLAVQGNLNASDGTISIQLGSSSTLGNSLRDTALGSQTAGTAGYQSLVDAGTALPTSSYEGTVTATTGGNGGSGTASVHDYIDIQGALTLNGSSRIQILANGGYTFTAGDIFDIFDWTSAVSAGAFSFGNTTTVGSSILRDGGLDGDLELPTLDAGLQWDLQKFLSNGILIVASTGVIPEPSRALLLVFGLGTLIMRRRRSSAK